MAYEPVWALCQDLDVPIGVHGGGGAPEDTRDPGWGAFVFLEANWYAISQVHRLVFGGVFERHPRLRFAITETTGTWVPHTLKNLDWLWMRMRTKNTNQGRFMDSAREITMKPSEYWYRNCWQGASFMGPNEVAARYEIGIDKLMWGSDYPHFEGTHPHTVEALRRAFAGLDPAEVQKLVGTNAAAMYGFDLDALVPLARELGPTVDEIATPLRDERHPRGRPVRGVRDRPATRGPLQLARTLWSSDVDGLAFLARRPRIRTARPARTGVR